MNRLWSAFTQTSIVFKLGFIGGIVVVWLLIFWAVQSRSYTKGMEAEKANTRALEAKYNALLGESKAHEQAAKEYQAQSDAKDKAIQAGNAKVKELDKQIDKAVERYEETKRNLGGCPDVATCNELLCKELAAVGFPCTN